MECFAKLIKLFHFTSSCDSKCSDPSLFLVKSPTPQKNLQFAVIAGLPSMIPGCKSLSAGQATSDTTRPANIINTLLMAYVTVYPIMGRVLSRLS